MDKIKLIEALLSCNSDTKHGDDFIVGKNYLIRTVTNYYTGTVMRITDRFVHLATAAWIADTGRFHDELSKNEFNEVEPYINSVGIGLGAIIDFTEISRVPTAQK